MNNYSKQREIILEVIRKNRIHPTAEEIYAKVVEEHPKISKSTVYRNINILVEQGLIQKIAMTSGPDRYDDDLQKSHYHAICEKCGKVFDFNHEFELASIEKRIQKQSNIKMEITSITVRGICETCKSKQKN